MDLREYEQIKFEFAEVLRSVQTFVPRDRHDRHERIRELSPGSPRTASTSLLSDGLAAARHR